MGPGSMVGHLRVPGVLGGQVQQPPPGLFAIPLLAQADGFSQQFVSRVSVHAFIISGRPPSARRARSIRRL